jgi:DNA-binding PadR family transcriptional regulator
MDISQPLTPPVLYLLVALADGDLYGYALMRAVRERSGGTVVLRTGSFYRYLSQLVDHGLVAEAPGRRPGDDPRRGAYYRLTPRGRKRLDAERRRLEALVASIALRPAPKGNA